jgi:uncharacterized membrane protein YfcA
MRDLILVDLLRLGLPLFLLVMTAVLAVRIFRGKDNEDQQVRLVWGMAIGTAVGLFVGIAHLMRLGLAVSCGLYAGAIIGATIQKKKKK